METPEEERAPMGFAVITERGTDPPEEHLFTDDEEWGSRHNQSPPNDIT